jgi:hypothetical protein
MFETTATGSLLEEVRAYDFGSDPVAGCGANRIDAIRELDRSIRAAQAEQVAQIAALHAERSTVMRLGEGDPSLSVIGEVAMARNIGPGAAGSQLALAIGMSQLPKVFALFRGPGRSLRRPPGSWSGRRRHWGSTIIRWPMTSSPRSCPA